MPNDFSSTENSQGLLKDYYATSTANGNKIAESVLKKRTAEMADKVKAQSEQPE